jgi:hypothetical protein
VETMNELKITSGILYRVVLVRTDDSEKYRLHVQGSLG